MKCPYCDNSTAIIKTGVRGNKSGLKQMYRCKQCNKKFTLKNICFKKKYPSRVIYFVLRKRRDGLNATEIHQDIQRYFDIDVSVQTVYNWINKIDEDPINVVTHLKELDSNEGRR